MTIDRHGRKIVLGYAAHELIWLEAANSLPAYDRALAFEDIASMTGRSVVALREKANDLRKIRIHAEWLRNASAMTASCGPGYRPRVLSSDLAPASLASRMAGNGRLVKSRCVKDGTGVA